MRTGGDAHAVKSSAGYTPRWNLYGGRLSVGSARGAGRWAARWGLEFSYRIVWIEYWNWQAQCQRGRYRRRRAGETYELGDEARASLEGELVDLGLVLVLGGG